MARTRNRPLASGAVSVPQAMAMMAALLLIGLLVLLQFNAFTVWLGIASLALVAVYPFAKRVTHWPQAVLGLAFNWGALVGFSAVRGTSMPPPSRSMPPGSAGRSVTIRSTRTRTRTTT